MHRRGLQHRSRISCHWPPPADGPRYSPARAAEDWAGSVPSDSTSGPPGLRRASSGARTALSPALAANGSPPPRPSSGLVRTGSLKRELGIPQQEAAASLRRAMSCCPDLQGMGGDGGEGAGARRNRLPASLPMMSARKLAHSPTRLMPSGLASMFNFSHAARVTPNRVCCNALLAAYARAKPPQYLRVSRCQGHKPPTTTSHTHWPLARWYAGMLAWERQARHSSGG